MDKDLLVIGGGINGVGTAADAAGRGLSVVLCEMGDLASATSSASSKLIHGGLRYLENYDFKLVWESLRERGILQHLAPHLIKTQPFILPHCPWLRPYWLIRSALFLYDRRSRGLSDAQVQALGLQAKYTKALQYYDCTEDDSRLTLHVALLAKQHGAEILTRTKLVKALRKDDHWLVSLASAAEIKTLRVKAIVNAAGPWTKEVANNVLNIQTEYNMRWVKGSHIVVPKLFSHDQAFILQTEDGRVVFLIPYLHDFTLIGTTDVPVDTIDPPIKISSAEIDYLCKVTNDFVLNKISAKDIVHSWAGVRALVDDQHKSASKITREYFLDINAQNPQAPVISVFGGKITTYRSLAEHIGNKLQRYFPHMGKAWTKKAYLPGGYFLNNDLNSFSKYLQDMYPKLPENLLQHYLDNYGTRVGEILRDVRSIGDLGQHFGSLLYEKEVDYLVEHEWAQTAEDILWRRGKMGMWFSKRQVENLQRYLQV